MALREGEEGANYRYLYFRLREVLKRGLSGGSSSYVAEADQNGGHIIASEAVGRIRGQNGVEQIFEGLSEARFACNLAAAKIDELLVGFRLPDAVAPHQDELVFGGELCLRDIRVRTD